MKRGVVVEQQRRARLHEVARRADVGVSTASRALNGRGYVSETARLRVLAAARDLDYLPHGPARTLRAGHSSTIGVIVSNLRDPFYCELATAIEATLQADGFNMILLTDGGLESAELSAVDTLLAQQVAGVILTPASGRAVARVLRHAVPVVQVDRIVPRLRTDSVTSGNVEGVEAATRHLLEHGHRCIAMLIDEAKWTTGQDRLRGFRQAHRAAGMVLDERLVVLAPGNVAEVQRRAGQLLDTRPDVTAMVAVNGVLAEGVFVELQRRRRVIPGDVSLVAYDDLPWMRMVQPAITAVSQHTQELGRAAAQTLLERLNGSAGEKPISVTVAPTLLVRQSVAEISPHD